MLLAMDDAARLRCLCGHFASEHGAKPHGGFCYGNYATLTLESDDESVEVQCPCDNLILVADGYHQVR